MPATPDIARVRALSRGNARGAGALTGRELQVLRLVAAGVTNRAQNDPSAAGRFGRRDARRIARIVAVSRSLTDRRTGDHDEQHRQRRTGIFAVQQQRAS
jgi:hypothetical protein